MTPRLCVSAVLAFLLLAPLAGARECVGADPCRACKDCSRCRACDPRNPKGGSCGTCRNQDAAAAKKRLAKTR